MIVPVERVAAHRRPARAGREPARDPARARTHGRAVARRHPARRRRPGATGFRPGFPRYKSPPRQDLIATAYYAHAADLAARIADMLDRPALAASNRALRDQARTAYQRAYIAPDGRVADDVQTSYLLTLAFDLAPPEQREQIAGTSRPHVRREGQSSRDRLSGDAADHAGPDRRRPRRTSPTRFCNRRPIPAGCSR